MLLEIERRTLFSGAMLEHKSRFKAYLIPSCELDKEAVQLRPYFEELESLQSNMSDAEFVLSFIFIYVQARLPNQWWISKGKSAITATKNLRDGFEFSRFSTRFDFLKHIQAQNLQSFCEMYNFKKLPGAILTCLEDWFCGKSKLILKSKPITPLAMLEAQAQGQRIVTLDMPSAMAGVQVDGQRDAFEFLLHDLIHAELFFGQEHHQQVQFFKSFEDVLKNPSPLSDFFSDALKVNAEFNKDISYLMSDMNSHTGHMQAQLKASLIKHQLWREKKATHETLSAEGRSQLEHHWSLLNNLIFP